MNRYNGNGGGVNIKLIAGAAVAILAIMMLMALWGIYTNFRIDVPSANIAVLTRKTGVDIENNQVVSPDEKHKGLQLKVLTEGRYYVNPYTWDWKVYPMVEVPAGKLGVLVRLYGDNLGYGEYLATKDTQKGIVAEVLRPGRYPYNAVIKGQEGLRKDQDYVEIVELYDPVIIPAGFKGVVTNLAGPMPEDPNKLLVPKGYRGVQEETLDPGTYYLNPYAYRVNTIDCRSQRFNLAENQDMGFPSKDGFWVTLDGIVEFRVKPEKAAETYVVYNELGNDHENGESTIHEEIVRKIIMPNARAFCRLRGSSSSGREFIGGETRTAMQKDFHAAMTKACEVEGIDVVQALITKIVPPNAIAKPVRDREVAKQQLSQYAEQTKQQKAERGLANEKATIEQKKMLVDAEQTVVKRTTKARREQQVQLTLAQQKLEVARKQLEAAKDLAAATLAKKKAEAGVIDYTNAAEAAGWQKAVEALGNGDAFARYVLLQKLAPSYRSMMMNTADSPLMDVFRHFNSKETKGVPVKPPVAAN